MGISVSVSSGFSDAYNERILVVVQQKCFVVLRGLRRGRCLDTETPEPGRSAGHPRGQCRTCRARYLFQMMCFHPWGHGKFCIPVCAARQKAAHRPRSRCLLRHRERKTRARRVSIERCLTEAVPRSSSSHAGERGLCLYIKSNCNVEEFKIARPAGSNWLDLGPCRKRNAGVSCPRQCDCGWAT